MNSAESAGPVVVGIDGSDAAIGAARDPRSRQLLRARRAGSTPMTAGWLRHVSAASSTSGRLVTNCSS
jgi:hypothetical protein